MAGITYFRASLPEPSNEDRGNPEIPSVLFENGIPQVNSFFSYVNRDFIEISNINYNPNSEYELQYHRLTELETEVFDLGENFLDYDWYLDVCAYIRRNLTEKREEVTEQLIIRDGFEAVLTNPVLTTAPLRLSRTNGVITEEIPTSAITFLSNDRISISQRFFRPTFIYTLTYTAVVIERLLNADMTLEYRSGVDEDDVVIRPWIPFEVNDLADTRFTLEYGVNKRYLQMRIRVNNIKREDDVHIYSATVRGLLYPEEDREIAFSSPSIKISGTATSISQLESNADGQI